MVNLSRFPWIFEGGKLFSGRPVFRVPVLGKLTLTSHFTFFFLSITLLIISNLLVLNKKPLA
jgi:hypothetical protein